MDLDTSSVSDPGMSGMLCPTVKLYDNFFTDFEEVNGWDEVYKKRVHDYYYKERKMINPIILQGEEEPFDYEWIKEENIRKSLGGEKICPIIDLSGDTDYYKTNSNNDSSNEVVDGSQLVDMKSLFDIRENPTPTPIQEEATKEYIYEPYIIKEDNTIM